MESSIRIIDNSANSDSNLILCEFIKNNQNLIISSIGPINSKFKLFQSNLNSDNLLATTTSKHLIEILYRIDNEKLKNDDSNILTKWIFDLIHSTLIKSHCNLHFDSGLFAVYLINQAILLKSEKSLVNKIFVDLIEHLVSSEALLVKSRLNLDNLKHLKALLSGCLYAKKIIEINQADQFLYSFLKLLIRSFNNEYFSRILYIFNEDMLLNLNDCQIFDGILVKTEQEEFDSIQNLRCLILNSNCLSGDFEEFQNFDLKFQINLSKHKSNNERFLNLEYLIDRIKIIVEKLKIDAIFCQKVIHPSIKHYFKLNHKRLFFLDRLGIDLAKPIQEALNCKMCNSVSCDIDESYIGKLAQISLINLHRKNYFYLQSQVPLQTIVIGVQNECFTSEMEYALKVSEKSFQRTILSGYGLIGGPCFYSYCINFLWSKIENKRKEIKNLIFIKNLFYIFLKSLINEEYEYYMCLYSGHFFKIGYLECECGMIIRQNNDNLYDLNDSDLRQLDISLIFSNQNSFEINLNNLKLIDCLQSKINAFKIARDILSTYLHVGILVTS